MQISNLAGCLVISFGLVGYIGGARAQGVAEGPKGSIERFCAPNDKMAEHQARFAEHLAKHLDLSEAQKTQFKAFQDARVKQIESVKTRLCGSKPDLSTFEARLKFHQTYLEDRLEAVKAENPQLIAFYKSLSAEQQAKFDRASERIGKRRGH